MHAEIGRLPERFRAAVILCYLEGRTYQEAARVLRCPVGTIKSRLATARDRLRRRMEHLNLAPSAGSAGFVLKGPPVPLLPVPLAEATLRAVVQHTKGGVAPVSISQLAAGVLRRMQWHHLACRLGAASVVLACTGALAVGAVELTRINGGLTSYVPAAIVAQSRQGPPEEKAAKRPEPRRNGEPVTLTGRIADEQVRRSPGR